MASSGARPDEGPATTYVYVDANSDPLFRVVKRAGKKFHQERYEDGRWIRGLGDTPRVLYNLPAVMDAAEHNKVVWVVEGEKDADVINAHGAIATTNPGGTGKWRDEYSQMLVGVRRVMLVWDNDKPDPKTGKRPGRDHALQIERSLRRVEVPVRLLRALEGNDTADHLEAGHSLSELVRERPGARVTEAGDPAAPRTSDPAVFQLAMIRLREHAAQNQLTAPRKSETGYEACCPAHDDHNPSLGIMVGDDQPLVVTCQAGCSLADIAEALDIPLRDFSEHKPQYDAALEKEIQRIKVRDEARVIVNSESMSVIEPPPLEPLRYMTEDPPANAYTVEQLHTEGGNTLLVSQFKVGKTTFSINLYRSLVNREPFLDRFPVHVNDGKIAYLDYEMLEAQFRMWLQAGGQINTGRMVTPWHLRGTALSFWLPEIRKQLVQWLKSQDAVAMIIDTAARASLGIDENSNTDMLRFTDALDQLKGEAGVEDLFLVTHMGRPSPFVQEGEERARGATRLEDWMDHGWYLTRDREGKRYFRASGRGVDVESTLLDYMPATRKLSTAGILKVEHDERTADEQVVDALAAFATPPSTSELRDAIPGTAKDQHGKILSAERRGLIERKKGARNSMYCHMTAAGEALQNRRVTQT
jgi:hypothetical protein